HRELSVHGGGIRGLPRSPEQSGRPRRRPLVPRPAGGDASHRSTGRHGTPGTGPLRSLRPPDRPSLSELRSADREPDTVRSRLGPLLRTEVGLATTLRSLAVGLGFIGAEIVLLQRLTLYLGQPALALSLGLAALLIGAAIGSGWSSRLPTDPDKASALCAIVLPVLLLALTWVATLTF